MKTPNEKGIWVLDFDHAWGSRGSRTHSVFYFRRKPPETKIEEIMDRHGIPAGTHKTLTRLMCGRRYERTTNHGI